MPTFLRLILYRLSEAWWETVSAYRCTKYHITRAVVMLVDAHGPRSTPLHHRLQRVAFIVDRTTSTRAEQRRERRGMVIHGGVVFGNTVGLR